MFAAISVHKLVIAFVVSLQLYDQSRRMLAVAIHMAIFAVMSPLGILVVIVAEDSLLDEDSESNPVIIGTTAIATGTLLYIIIYEILPNDKLSGFKRFLSVLCGFVFMTFINILLTD